MNEIITVALAGNANVGKSTIFNTLTGMKQHTGNWTGKTVDLAAGYFKTDKHSYKLIDLPGTYSLLPHSPEEEIARMKDASCQSVTLGPRILRTETAGLCAMSALFCLYGDME